MIFILFLFVLPDLDSNQDIQNQNLLYYPYTIRQSFFTGCKNKGVFIINQKNISLFTGNKMNSYNSNAASI